MLEDSLFESQSRNKTRKPVTVVVSVAAHVVTASALLLVPLVHTQAIAVPSIGVKLWAPKMPVQRSIEVVAARTSVSQAAPSDPVAFVAPKNIPREIIYVNEPPSSGPIPGLPLQNGLASSGGGSPFGDLFRRPSEFEPPKPPAAPPVVPPAPQPVKATPVRVSQMERASLIHQVSPVYPNLAKVTRTQGVVVVEATISKEGGIESLRVVSGHPLLIQAAVDAVKQWRYRPLILNGEPVEVLTTITVTFSMQ